MPETIRFDFEVDLYSDRLYVFTLLSIPSSPHLQCKNEFTSLHSQSNVS